MIANVYKKTALFYKNSQKENRFSYPPRQQAYSDNKTGGRLIEKHWEDVIRMFNGRVVESDIELHDISDLIA
jgi:hypothetical protein